VSRGSVYEQASNNGENRSRRDRDSNDSLKIWLAEQFNKQNEKIDELNNTLQLDTERIDFSIVHRLGPFMQGRPRCMIAKFRRRSDAVKDVAVNLPGTKYGKAEDLSGE